MHTEVSGILKYTVTDLAVMANKYIGSVFTIAWCLRRLSRLLYRKVQPAWKLSKARRDLKIKEKSSDY